MKISLKFKIDRTFAVGFFLGIFLFELIFKKASFDLSIYNAMKVSAWIPAIIATLVTLLILTMSLVLSISKYTNEETRKRTKEKMEKALPTETFLKIFLRIFVMFLTAAIGFAADKSEIGNSGYVLVYILFYVFSFSAPKGKENAQS